MTITEYRVSKNYTLLQLAEEWGISIHKLKRALYTNDNVVLPAEALEKIKACGVVLENAFEANTPRHEIIALRTKLNLSPQEMADKLRISERTYKKIESGSAPLSPTVERSINKLRDAH